MPAPGWYPDPSGSGGLRYWSGTAWTEQVSPVGPSIPGPPSRRRRWLVPLIAGGAVTVAVLVLVIALAVRSPGTSGDDPRTDVSPTGSVWHETSTPNETSTPTPSGGRPADCDVHAAAELPEPTPHDGRLTVGHLSMPVPDDWSGPVPESRMPYGRDAYGFTQRIATETKMGWASSMTIGVVTFPADTALSTIAATMAQCVVTSDFYAGVDVKVAKNTTTSIRVSGHEGVQNDLLLTFHHPQLTTTGSQVRVIAVRTSGATQFFFSAVPQENAQHKALVEAVTRGLTTT